MRNPTILAFCVLLSAAGCGDSLDGGDDFGDDDDDFGATPGGVKDLTLARQLIAQGLVPPADALLVEAMFAEHDLAIEGGECTTTLCLKAAAGVAPEVDGAPRGWVQVGLSSSIDKDTWERPSTTFVFVVDVSGSMSWGYQDDEYPSGGRLAAATLHGLTDLLRDDDRVALVTYGSDVATPLPLTSGAEKSLVHDRIDALAEDGSTNMEAGMVTGYQIGRSAVGTTEQVRVIVFTDVQPNVGFTEASEFEVMASDAADDDVETTVLAFGLGIGPEVMRGMAALRGANAYSMTTLDEVDTWLADRAPYFATPIAYDLRVQVATDDGWAVDRGIGFPAASDGEQIGLKAETIFLSKGRGALLVALAPPAGADAALPPNGSFNLQYLEPSGVAIEEDLAFVTEGPVELDERGQWFAQHGVARTTALAILTEAMHDAALAYATDHDAAEAILAPAAARFTADAAALADDDLPIEVQLVTDLLALIQADAEQGTLYP